ncbi:hypothetical protein CLS_38120 [[Clostridium] cf. saccharolyticum K10]|nr:hypothetical protein CLS_38120 [[Clostridium] cf. saccharolyticum K10]
MADAPTTPKKRKKDPTGFMITVFFWL